MLKPPSCANSESTLLMRCSAVEAQPGEAQPEEGKPEEAQQQPVISTVALGVMMTMRTQDQEGEASTHHQHTGNTARSGIEMNPECSEDNKVSPVAIGAQKRKTIPHPENVAQSGGKATDIAHSLMEMNPECSEDDKAISVVALRAQIDTVHPVPAMIPDNTADTDMELVTVAVMTHEIVIL